MHLDSIQLFNFRNYQKQNLRFFEGINVFIGKNGQGKTNLLDAIYTVTQGSSFRAGTSETSINFSSEDKQAFTKAIIENKGLKSLIKIEFDQNKKSILLNQKKTNGAYLSKNFPCVLFSPESLASIKDGPEKRRDLLDQWLRTCIPQTIQVINDFKRVLKNRNQLLKSMKTGDISETEGFQLLGPINEIYLEKSLKLIMARIEAIEVIEPLITKTMNSIRGKDLKNVDISVDYLASGTRINDLTPEQISNALNLRMKELLQRELEIGHSLVGPHKHDIRFLFEKEDSRYYCSQGQQRALILSFKMAQIMYYYTVYQTYPVLLLDDVLSELDPEKRMHLIHFLKQINSQIFITTTDLEIKKSFDEQKIMVFGIQNGNVESKECL